MAMKAPLLGGLLLVGGILGTGPALAGTYDLVLEQHTLNVTGRERPAMLINGQLPGPVLRFKEGEDVVIRVTNKLPELTSIHWHGLILPSEQDGVPGVSVGFKGIPTGTTHTYRFPIKQAGTYWYHSHSATQEQTGIYAPIIIDPAKREPFRYDREYVVLLSDWTDENPASIIRNLKVSPGYYNKNRRTLVDFFRDAREQGFGPAFKDRWEWGVMRMDPTDIADVGGFTFLINGHTNERNFTALFKPNERVRLRFINASAMTYFDVRIPGLKMTVVQADGNNVQPTPVDEFRIAVSETYDVIVQPREERAYSILAESMDRAGFARATLAPREGMVGEIPPHRPRPLLTMADMGTSFGPTGLDRGTAHPETDRPGHVAPMAMDHGDMAGMNHGSPAPSAGAEKPAPPDQGSMAGMDHSQMAGMDHSQMEGMDHSGMAMPDPLANDTGAPQGAKVLSYKDLKALASPYDAREPDRVIEIRLTGNMERFFWSINARKFSEAEPIVLRYGERVRFRFINETMMNHPMHLHGMWMLPRVGNGARDPMKHVVNIKPGSTLDVDIPADAEGGWAFHCHLLYHMETGMMRKVDVVRADALSTQPKGS
jgi:CopA family copper-resistance protein